MFIVRFGFGRIVFVFTVYVRVCRLCFASVTYNIGVRYMLHRVRKTRHKEVFTAYGHIYSHFRFDGRFGNCGLRVVQSIFRRDIYRSRCAFVLSYLHFFSSDCVIVWLDLQKKNTHTLGRNTDICRERKDIGKITLRQRKPRHRTVFGITRHSSVIGVSAAAVRHPRKRVIPVPDTCHSLFYKRRKKLFFGIPSRQNRNIATAKEAEKGRCVCRYRHRPQKLFRLRRFVAYKYFIKRKENHRDNTKGRSCNSLA